MLVFMYERRLKEVEAEEILKVVEDCFEQMNNSLRSVGWYANFTIKIERFSAPGDLNCRASFTYMNTFATQWESKVTEEEIPCRCYLREFSIF